MKISEEMIKKQRDNNKQKNMMDYQGSIIIAPHPDDEIIGCYDIVKNEKPIIMYMGDDIDSERRKEALELRNHANISMQFFLNSIPNNYLREGITFYFPDPIFETHPKHRLWGSFGEQLSRNGIDVIFYTTNMTAPYIREMKNSKEKEELLNKVYPSQKSLWEWEKKYILFQGHTKWIF